CLDGRSGPVAQLRPPGRATGAVMADANGSARSLTTTNYRVEIGGQTVAVEIAERDDGQVFVRIGDGPRLPVSVAVSREDGELGLLVGGEVVCGLVGTRADGMTLVVDGQAVDATELDERAVRLASATAGGRHLTRETAIRAPMPGLVVAVS